MDKYLSEIGLALSASKMEAFMVHSSSKARFDGPKLSLRGFPIPWSTSARYLGVDIDHRLS